MNTNRKENSMEDITQVAYYEAFSDIKGKGNPAGVVFDSDQLTEEQMQMIAKKVGFHETVFLLKSEKADL